MDTIRQPQTPASACLQNITSHVAARSTTSIRGLLEQRQESPNHPREKSEMVGILIFIMRETADLSSTGVPKAQAQLDAKTRDRDSKPAPGTQPIQAEQCSSPGADHVPNGKVN